MEHSMDMSVNSAHEDSTDAMPKKKHFASMAADITGGSKNASASGTYAAKNAKSIIIAADTVTIKLER